MTIFPWTILGVDSKEITIKMMQPLQSRFQYLNTRLYLLRHMQHCCQPPVEKVANKYKQVSILKNVIRKVEENRKNKVGQNWGRN